MKNKNIPQQEEDEYIIIPNPIYDVVFRYLMEDTESAKIVISTIINQKIKTLIPEPLTHTEKDDELTDPQTNEVIRLFHLDFTAIVELPDGTTYMEEDNSSIGELYWGYKGTKTRLSGVCSVLIGFMF